MKWAKENKGKLSYSSLSARHPRRISSAPPTQRKIRSRSHPRSTFNGSGAQANALLGGHSLFGFAQLNSTFQLVQSGKLKALAVTSEKRDPALPDVPSFAELGYPEFTAKIWFGLLVKEGTPPDVLKRLTDAAVAAHADPDIRSKLEGQGFKVSAETGPQLKTEIASAGGALPGKLVQASGFSADDRGSTK